jgi:hypothetical protein
MPARLRRRVAESRFASPLVGSGQPPKRTSESCRSPWGRLGRSRFRASGKARLSQTARASPEGHHPPNRPRGPSGSVPLVDGNSQWAADIRIVMAGLRFILRVLPPDIESLTPGF